MMPNEMPTRDGQYRLALPRDSGHDIHRRLITRPSGQLTSPVSSLWGKASIWMAKMLDMKDRGSCNRLSDLFCHRYCVIKHLQRTR